MIKISERLKVAASLISDGNVLADVGTDHGYVPIYLMEQKKIPKAIAMDINQGPLERAKEHIVQYHMEKYIETRLSDGVTALLAGEADTILIAGMGGGLVIHILSEGALICQKAGELVLQPQSELERVRQFLREEGYITDAEEMVLEDGKYYPMMRVHFDTTAKVMVKQRRIWDIYGRFLLEQQHPVLLDFLKKERRIYHEILGNLMKQPQTEQISFRIQEIKEALAQNGEALHCYDIWEG